MELFWLAIDLLANRSRVSAHLQGPAHCRVFERALGRVENRVDTIIQRSYHRIVFRFVQIARSITGDIARTGNLARPNRSADALIVFVGMQLQMVESWWSRIVIIVGVHMDDLATRALTDRLQKTKTKRPATNWRVAKGRFADSRRFD